MSSHGMGMLTPERLESLGKIALTVVLCGILVGIFSADMEFYYIAAAVISMLLIVVLVWNFECALVIYLVVAFVPWGRTPDIVMGGSGAGKGLYVSEIMLAFLLLVWLGKYFANSLPKNRIKTGFYVPIGLYIAYSVFNVISSFLFWDPHVNKIYQNTFANVAELGLHVLSAGAFAMMATSITTKRWLMFISIALMVPGIFNTFNAYLGGVIPVVAVWWAMLTLLPACFALVVAFTPYFNKWFRLACFVVLCLMVFYIVVLNISWVSGYFALLAALAATAFIFNKKLFFAGCLIAVIVAVAFWGVIQSEIIDASEAEGDYDRFALFEGSIKYAKKFPLGVGLGNYRTYNSFHYGNKWGTTSYTSAHGTYAQHLSEMGFLGTALFVSILLFGSVWLYKSYLKMPQGYSKVFVLATIGQIVGISCASGVGDYIIPTYHNGGIVTFSTTVYSWLIWGTAVAHVRLTLNESEK